MEKDYTSTAGARLNHPDDLKKYFSSKTFKDHLLDKTNPLVYCTLIMEGKDFLEKSSYSVELHQKTNDHDGFTIIVPDDSLDSFQGYVMENSKNILGKRLTLNLHRFGEVKQLFTGIVANVKNKKENGYGKLYISGFAPSILLENGPDCQSYEEKTLEQIIKSATSEYPEDCKVQIENPNTKYQIPYTVQYKESDYQFIKRLATRYGEYFYYNGQNLIFGNKVQPIITLEENIDLIDVEFELKIKPQEFNYISYDAENGSKIEKDSSSAQIQYKENPFQAVAINASKNVYKKKPEMLFNHTGISSGSDRELKEAVRKEREKRENLVSVRGKSKDPELKIGGRAKLSDINGKAMETYRIIEIKHFHDGNTYYNEFVAIPDLFTAPYQDDEALPLGEKQSAKVLDNNDPMGMGRVRVQFPWQEKKNLQTPWLRLIQPHSGSGKGFHFIPEIGEEVLVGFESQNAEKPFVIGAHYNGNEVSGYHTAGNDIKAIKTRTNNKLVLDDGQGSLLLQDSSNSYIEMDGKREIEINTDVLKINVNKLIINASLSTEITTNDYILNALSRIYVFSNWMKQSINGFMHLFSNSALINSPNAINIEAKETKLHGTEKSVVHSDKLAYLNSKGTAEIHGEQGNQHTNKAKEISKAVTDKIALAAVYFLPKSKNGEFGFDYLRDGIDPKDPAYKDLIISGYNSKGRLDLTKDEAYEQLKSQYERIPMKTQQSEDGTKHPDREYFVPYMTLFSQEFVEKEASKLNLFTLPKYQAELDVFVEIGEDVEYLKFDYDQTLFEIDKPQLTDNTKTEGRIPSKDSSITITCLKDLDKDKEIYIYAYPKGFTQGSVERKLAGKIIVLKNDSTVRKEEKIVLVSVKTDAFGGRATVATFSKESQYNLCNMLYQALIIPRIVIDEKKIILDLSNVKHYQKGGCYINKDVRFQAGEDSEGIAEMRRLFLDNQKSIAQEDGTAQSAYEKYFTVFATTFTNEDKDVIGKVEQLGKRNTILFADSDPDTMAHEVLHGLGLYHTHLDGTPPIINKKIKYVYEKDKTNNIMSYSTKKSSSWRWQWNIINPKISEK